MAFSSFKQIENFKLESGSFNSAVVRYSWDKKPISSVDIELRDYERTLSITSKDDKKVDALYRDISEQLNERKVFLSTIDLPAIFTTLFIMLFILSIYIFSYTLEAVWRKKSDRHTTILFSISVIIVIGLSIYFFSSYEMKDFFPGFKLTADTSTWWDKHQSLVELLSFLGATVAFITKAFKKLWHGEKSE